MRRRRRDDAGLFAAASPRREADHRPAGRLPLLRLLPFDDGRLPDEPDGREPERSNESAARSSTERFELEVFFEPLVERESVWVPLDGRALGRAWP
ncbi:MAG: hypothetical protein MUC96_14315 [Myxococcaceae bacterium]|nr:hypothetical protein [Myxococcaceae bacterium]